MDSWFVASANGLLAQLPEDVRNRCQQECLATLGRLVDEHRSQALPAPATPPALAPAPVRPTPAPALPSPHASMVIRPHPGPSTSVLTPAPIRQHTRATSKDDVFPNDRWLNTPQASDAYGKRQAYASIVHFGDDAFGSLNFENIDKSFIRFRPSNWALFTYFAFVISYKPPMSVQTSQNKPKTASKSGTRSLAELERVGFADGRNPLLGILKSDLEVREVFQLDLDKTGTFSIEIVEAAKDKVYQSALKASGNGTSHYGANAMVAKMVITTKPGQTFKHVGAFQAESSASFDPYSRQSAFKDTLRGADRMTVFAGIPTKQLLDDFNMFRDLYTRIRALSKSGNPRTDWFLTRAAEYNYDSNKTLRFLALANKQIADLPIPPWLKNGKFVTRAFISTQQPAPITLYPSLEMYQMVQTQAVLAENDVVQRLILQTYNPDRLHEAKFIAIGLKVRVEVKVVKIKEPEVPAKLPPGSRIKVVADNGPEVAEFVGTIMDEAEEGSHFEIISDALGSGIQDVSLWHNKTLKAKVAVWTIDTEMTHQVEAFGLVVDKTAPVDTFAHDGEERAPFSIKTFLCGDTYAKRGLNFLKEYEIRATKANIPAAEQAQVLNLVNNAIPAWSRFSSTQKMFYDNALQGACEATVVLEGWLGTGKSLALSALTLALLLLRFKVLQTARTNQGADAVFRYTIAAMEAHQTELKQLLPHALRWHSGGVEKHIAAAIYQLEDLGRAPSVADSNLKHPYSLSAMIKKWVLDNPKTQLSKDWLEWQSAKAQHRRAQVKMSLSDINKDIQQHILKSVSLLSATSSIAWSASEAGWHPDIVIFDEASQATEGDFARAVIRSSPLLVVLAGDPAQMSPIVLSSDPDKNQNIYGNVLSTSVLERTIYSKPRGSHFKLKQSYRGHPSTFWLASRLIYGSQLVTGLPKKDWTTNVSNSVRKMLMSAPYANKFQPQTLAQVQRDTCRQFFFDVGGHSVREQEGFSSFNPAGDFAVCQFASDLVNRAGVSAAKISILTMYKADLKALQTGLAERGVEGIEVKTVNSFQGGQNKIVILHFVAAVRDGPNPVGRIGQPNRLCVALTRSEEFLFLFGNISWWLQCRRSGSSLLGKDERFNHIVALMDHVMQQKQIVKW
ncbi:hypothetical protein MBLNU459_g4170t1 [Dothideomycetes sp. NU459]